MKRKVTTYVLLVLVLGVWGAIGHQIVSAVSPSESETVVNDYDPSFSPKTLAKVEPFSLTIPNRDPFLGTLFVKKKPIKTKTAKTTKLTWPAVRYHGNISKQNTKTKVFIVSVNGQQNLMKIGQTINEVMLLRGSSSSISVSYKGARKTIKKS